MTKFCKILGMLFEPKSYMFEFHSLQTIDCEGSSNPSPLILRSQVTRFPPLQAGIMTDAKGIKVAATEYWNTGSKRCIPRERKTMGQD
jgi:hypothetical protein